MEKWLLPESSSLHSAGRFKQRPPGSCNLCRGIKTIKATLATALALPAGFPGSSDSKESVCNAGDASSLPGLGRSPEEGNGQPIPVFLPGEFHGERSLVGYSSWGHKESDVTERLRHTPSDTWNILCPVAFFHTPRKDHSVKSKRLLNQGMLRSAQGRDCFPPSSAPGWSKFRQNSYKAIVWGCYQGKRKYVVKRTLNTS